MAFWQNIWSWLGGSGSSRNAGNQISGPMGYATASPVEVNEDSAMQLSAVWACVRLLSETVASLPVNVYRKTAKGRDLAPDHWLSLLMARKPNRYQTKVEFFETLMLNLALHGNAYAKITKVGGQIRSLLPLMASQIETKLLPDGSVVHLYHADGNVDVLSSDSVWHVKLYGNGIVGKSPLAFGRNMFGIAQAAEQSVSKIYANGGKPSGVLSFDRLLTPAQRASVRENFATLTTGTDDRLLVIEQGMKFDAVSMSPQDIELLASRKHQIDEIARWFGVPSILINQNEGSTTLGSSTAEIISGFYKLNLRPYLERIEASVTTWLFTPEEANQYEFEFDFEGLLRSDLKSRLEGYRTAVAGTILTPNEVRRIEGWPRVEGGDVLLSQINMTPID
ncbi:MAG: phage portal protein [Burkholderiales bacterium]|nr:phage portal protein [Burkholderiales bacterium]